MVRTRDDKGVEWAEVTSKDGVFHTRLEVTAYINLLLHGKDVVYYNAEIMEDGTFKIHPPILDRDW